MLIIRDTAQRRYSREIAITSPPERVWAGERIGPRSIGKQQAIIGKLPSALQLNILLFNSNAGNAVKYARNTLLRVKIPWPRSQCLFADPTGQKILERGPVIDRVRVIGYDENLCRRVLCSHDLRRRDTRDAIANDHKRA